MSKTVKAREHHGADSLDITVPTSVVKDKEISTGDIFEVNVEKDEGDLVIKYRRIYESDEN